MPLDSNIKQIKIHPAIGFARLSTSPEYYVFDPTNPLRVRYKAGNLIMRQAVQFRLFAYGDNNEGLYELTAEKLAEMGIRAIWSADLANGKIEEQTRNPADRFAARGDTSSGTLHLVGNLSTFYEGSAIPMGELTENGLFIPPVAGIFRRTAITEVRERGLHDENVSDNTCDGSIGVRIVSLDGNPSSVSTLPAWISVGPQDFAPSWEDIGDVNLLRYLQRILDTPNMPAQNPINQRARELDHRTIERGTAAFGPGIELNGPFRRSQFYPVSVTNDPDEIRFMPSRGSGAGMGPGDGTDGLCSPWQYDFRACTCVWWPNQRPDVVFSNNGQGDVINWRRKIASETGSVPAGGMLENNPDFINHVHELGIIKKAPNDPAKRAETERDNDVTDQIV